METLAEIQAKPIIASPDLILELISLIDLTTLSETDTDKSVLKLVEKANQGFRDVHPAALCTYSQFGSLVRKNLNTNIQTCVVGLGFPSGTLESEKKIDHALTVVNSGADELDIVLNHRDFFDKNHTHLSSEIRQIKTVIGTKHLKVILETGALQTRKNIRKASEIACLAGADFIKTSTGKTPIGATPEAIHEMCLVISEHYKETGRKVGIKPSGGIRNFEEAALIHTIIKEILGKDWLNPHLFRIGASSLYDNLIEKYETLT